MISISIPREPQSGVHQMNHTKMFTKVIFLLYLTLNAFTNCCDCSINNITEKNTNKTNDVVTEKRFFVNEDITPTEPSENLSHNEVTTKNIKLIETHFELNEEEFKTNTSQEETTESCANYKNGFAFDMDKMADVWQTAYYRMAEKLMCFKIHIKKTTVKDRKSYAYKYGDFNGTIDWDKCFLEIRSSETAYSIERKHFLQGNNTDQGVMENVVIFEEADGVNMKLTLHDESADQWLVIKNLLLMRDCDNGEVVVFSRVPHQPRLKDILEALSTFGEESINGTLACTDDERDGSFINRDVLKNVFSKFNLF